MKYVTKNLLEILSEQIGQTIEKVDADWQLLPKNFFTVQPGINKWSAAQCLEHLNSYGRYYLPAMETAIATAAGSELKEYYSSGWLGHYFYNLMLTDENGMAKKRMVSPKDHRPSSQLNPAEVLFEFRHQLERLTQVIKSAQDIDPGSVRVPISIAPFMKLKLGDVLLFYTAHTARHVAQADRALVAAGYLPPVNTFLVA